MEQHLRQRAACHPAGQLEEEHPVHNQGVREQGPQEAEEEDWRGVIHICNIAFGCSIVGFNVHPWSYCG